MAKRTTKPANSNELDGKEFFAAIAQIEQEKGIKPGYMMEKITQALLSAYRRDHEGVGDNLVIDADPDTCTVRLFLKKDIVEEVDNPATEISLEEARLVLPQAQLGDVVRMEIKPKNFGRVAAQTARQVIVQGIREAEQGMIYDEFCNKEHELLTGIVTRIDPRNGSVTLRIHSGSEFTDAYLGANEQVKGEHYVEGQRLKVYVVEVRHATKGPQVLISRTHPGLVKRLFEMEVPEIYDGTVEIKSVAREAGSRTKLAVWSADPKEKRSPLVGVGGTARAVLKLARQRFDLDGDCRTVTRAQLEELANLLTQGEREAAGLILKTAPDRIHTLVPGLMVLVHIIKAFHADELVVSRYGVREGYLCQMLQTPAAPIRKTGN